MGIHSTPGYRRGSDLILLALLLLGSACSRHPHAPAGDESPEGEQITARFIHLAPGLSRIDIYLEDDAAPIETLGFNHASSYRKVPSGSVSLTLVERHPSSAPPAHALKVDLPADAVGTIAIHEAPDGLTADFLAEPTEPPDPRVVPFPPPRFQLVHTARALASIDLYMPEEKVYLDGGGGGGQPGDPMERVYAGLGPGHATGFFGRYTVSPIVLDIGQDGNPDHLFDLSAASLTDITTFFVVRDVHEALFLVVLDAGGKVSVVDRQDP